ncbi:MAG TPA: hypothetical protein DEP48_02075 [Persephonella sp.]|uniref:Uncharacterized protein n=1 Tax=Persephonella marina (strain DSM 14350 / EX-H1) TaxID=123214 RepID=C0QRT3_PERMH|nr:MULTISPECIES: hypothetical protein [Persephonella]ACO04491.1 hypothetical protein PERMA_1613 [Persephonella marina EX-H1]HCB69124.1 hypothetical protein [Persephonella sp.]
MAQLTEKITSDTDKLNEKRILNSYYSKEDFILNRRVTILYGITFLFIFLSAVISEILSLIFNEGLLSPVQVVFHSVAFVGYVITFYYVYKKQDYIEEKNTEIFKMQEKIEKEEAKNFTE